jgi:hypothetical protein
VAHGDYALEWDTVEVWASPLSYDPSKLSPRLLGEAPNTRASTGYGMARNGYYVVSEGDLGRRRLQATARPSPQRRSALGRTQARWHGASSAAARRCRRGLVRSGTRRHPHHDHPSANRRARRVGVRRFLLAALTSKSHHPRSMTGGQNDLGVGRPRVARRAGIVLTETRWIPDGSLMAKIWRVVTNELLRLP